jgi:hypothetical protein
MHERVDSIERYLEELRVRLRGLPAQEVSEIVAELRSHLVESISSSDDAAAVLERVGSAAELASLYASERLLQRAGRSPWLLLRGLARWARFSIAGVFALLLLVAAYGVAASFFLAALLKPFARDRVGLWRSAGDEYSLRLGFSGAPPLQATELLGWWIVPIGLAIGCAALWLTPRIGRWALRRIQKERAS